jgi:exosome complex exonuclease DIS3/RRP44
LEQGLLTEKLCSLKGNIDRFAFSVIWKITPQADILDVQFCKSVIHSIGALTYGDAQAMLDNPALVRNCATLPCVAL